VLHGHTRQLEQLQEATEETKRSADTCEAQLQKVEFKVTSCVEEMAKLDQLAKVADVRKLEKAMAEKPGAAEAAAVQQRLAALSQETADSLREMGQKQVGLGSSVAAVQAEVARLADMTGLTEDLSVISSKVNQQKAKLIDIEANVTLQERSTCKVSLLLVLW
jgi:chromosome segregation ATPase